MNRYWCGLLIGAIAVLCPDSSNADPRRGHGNNGHHYGHIVRSPGLSWNGPSYFNYRSRYSTPYYAPGFSSYYYSPGYFGYGSYFGYSVMNPMDYGVAGDYYAPPPVDNQAILIVPPGQNQGQDEPIVAPRNAAEEPLVMRAKPRVSPPLARDRSRRYVEIGDRFFNRQQYESALEQYKLAAVATPDMALPLIRQTIAYVATRRFDSAIKTCRRAVEVEPEYVHSGFQLSALYGENLAPKNSHLETLASRALDNSEDAVPILLLGVMVYFDGDQQRADRFFRAAAPIIGHADSIIETFSDVARPVDADKVDT